jgi:antitoxin HicB
VTGVGSRLWGVGESGNLTLVDYLELPYRFDVRSQGEGERPPWMASVEELPGCVALGDTPEQAVAALRGAMEMWLSSALAEQREIPVPGKQAPRSGADRSYSGRFLVRMPKSLHDRLAGAAEQQQTSLNRLVCDLLAAAMAQGDRATPPATTLPQRAQPDRAAASQRTAPRSIRLVLATNVIVVLLAGVVAVVLLVLALQHGV